MRYGVANTGSGRMYFSIGSHPAFVVPFAGGVLENYYVLFDQEENLERWFFKDGMIVAGKTEEVLRKQQDHQPLPHGVRPGDHDLQAPRLP